VFGRFRSYQRRPAAATAKAASKPPSGRWTKREGLRELLPEHVDDPRPMADAELVGDDLAVLHDQEARGAALARQLVEDRLQVAGPEAFLVRLLELGRFHFDPRDLPVFRRSQPLGLVLVLP